MGAAQDAHTDSPVYQLVDGLPAPDVEHSKTDVFRERVEYNGVLKKRLAEARLVKGTALDRLRLIERELGNLVNVESGVVIDLFLSYRAVEAWQDMIRVKDSMSRPLQASVLVQEQFALPSTETDKVKKPRAHYLISSSIADLRVRPTDSWAACTRTAGMQQ